MDSKLPRTHVIPWMSLMRANSAPSWMDRTAWRRTDTYTPTLAGTRAEQRRWRANDGLCTDTSSWTDAAGAATPRHRSLVMQIHLPFSVLSECQSSDQSWSMLEDWACWWHCI